MRLPPLRYIDAFSVDYTGQQLVCLRDPEGIVEQQILLTPAAFFIASHLNGQRDLQDLQNAFAHQFEGQRLAAEDVQQLVHDLDQQGFLLTERFHLLRQQVEHAFLSAPIRPAYLAGKSCPE